MKFHLKNQVDCYLRSTAMLSRGLYDICLIRHTTLALNPGPSICLNICVQNEWVKTCVCKWWMDECFPIRYEISCCLEVYKSSSQTPWEVLFEPLQVSFRGSQSTVSSMKQWGVCCKKISITQLLVNSVGQASNNIGTLQSHCSLAFLQRLIRRKKMPYKSEGN